MSMCVTEVWVPQGYMGNVGTDYMHIWHTDTHT